MSCQGRQRQLRLRDRREPRSERSLMGTWNLHASSHRLGYYIYILPRPTAQENGVRSSQIWEKRMLCWIQEPSVHAHMMQYVEVCELLAGAPENYIYYIMNSCIFWDKHNEYGGKFFSKARQHPGVPCEPLKFSSQLPASFLEEVVAMHTLQAWKNNKIVRPRLVASTVKIHWVRSWNLKTVHF